MLDKQEKKEWKKLFNKLKDIESKEKDEGNLEILNAQKSQVFRDMEHRLLILELQSLNMPKLVEKLEEINIKIDINKSKVLNNNIGLNLFDKKIEKLNTQKNLVINLIEERRTILMDGIKEIEEIIGRKRKYLTSGQGNIDPNDVMQSIKKCEKTVVNILSELEYYPFATQLQTEESQTLISPELGSF